MLMPRQSSFPQHGGMVASQPSAQYDPSLTPQPSPHLISSLQHCVSSTASCVSTMKEAIDTLEFAIQDHPRLMTVLKSQRHFDLVSQRDIETAREHVAGEVRPHVEELCRRAAAEIARQDRRAVSLKNRYESLQQRIQNLRSFDEHQAKLNTNTDHDSQQQHVGSREQELLRERLEEERERLASLRAKKEALLVTADRLENEISGHV